MSVYDHKLSVLATSLILYIEAVKLTHEAERLYDEAVDAQFDAYTDYLEATEALTQQEAE
jgi:hypothetical protein